MEKAKKISIAALVPSFAERVRIIKMPQKLLILVEYARTFFAPVVGFGSFFAYLQTLDLTNKPVYAIIGTVVIAFFTYLGIRATTRTKVEVKEIEVTSSTDISKSALLVQIFDKATEDIERARQHFSTELKQQRADFFEKEKENRDHYDRKEEESRNYYSKKEEELRQGYHERLKDAGKTAEKYIVRSTKLEAQLKAMGIQVTEECEIILPASFERRKEAVIKDLGEKQ